MTERAAGSERTYRAKVRLGLAIGADRIIAVGPAKRGAVPVLEAPLATRPTAEGGWPELEEALRGLLRQLKAGRAQADVALLPPLSRSKCMDVPPVALAQLDPLVRHNLRRYFAVPYANPLGRAHPTVVKSGKVERALAVCADAGVIAAVCQSAEAAGVRITSMTAAPVALVEGIRRNLRPGRGRVVVAWGTRGWDGAMEIVDGVPQMLEDWSSLSSGAVVERRAAIRAAPDSDENPIQTIILTEPEEPHAGEPEQGTHPPDGEGRLASEHDPWILAAVGAGHRRHQPPSLLPGSKMAEIRRATRGRAMALWGAAASLLLASVGMQGYGLKRELAAVEEARALLGPQVTRALEVRRTAYAIRDRLEALSAIEEETPRWTPALAALTEVLPRSTYLVSLTTEGLSMRLGGVTSASEAIVPELQDSPVFSDVALTNVRASNAAMGGGTEFDLSLALQPTGRPSAGAGGGEG